MCAYNLIQHWYDCWLQPHIQCTCADAATKRNVVIDANLTWGQDVDKDYDMIHLESGAVHYALTDQKNKHERWLAHKKYIQDSMANLVGEGWTNTPSDHRAAIQHKFGSEPEGETDCAHFKRTTCVGMELCQVVLPIWTRLPNIGFVLRNRLSCLAASLEY